MDGTGLGLCLIVGFGISSFETLDSPATMSVSGTTIQIDSY
jgi:hypothetical protein